MNAEEPAEIPERKPPHRWRKIVGGVIGILVGLYLLHGLTLGPYREYGFCKVCGTCLTATFYQLPLTELTLYHRDTITDTPFSRGIYKYGFVGPHAHRWRIAYGRGNATACALFGGQDRDIYYRVNGENLDHFIDLLVQYRGQDFARRWTQRVLTLKPHDKATCMNLNGNWDLPRDDFEELMRDKQFTDDMLLTK
jgi:hypothetical protein